MKLGLDVHVLQTLVLGLLGVRDEDEGRERDPLVAPQRQLRPQGQAELDLVDAGSSRRAAKSSGEAGAARRETPRP